MEELITRLQNDLGFGRSVELFEVWVVFNEKVRVVLPKDLNGFYIERLDTNKSYREETYPSFENIKQAMKDLNL